MSKQIELITDIVAVCNRHGIESFQAVQVFADQELLGEVVRSFETTEAMHGIQY